MRVNVSRSRFFACLLFFFPKSFTEQIMVPIVQIRVVRIRGTKLLRRYNVPASEVPSPSNSESAS